MHRTLYAFALLSASLFAQTTLNLSKDLIRLGVAGGNMVPGQPALDSGPLLTAGIAYAQSHNFTTVVSDPGSYYFQVPPSAGGCYVQVDMSNLTVDFQASDLFLRTCAAPVSVLSGRI